MSNPFSRNSEKTYAYECPNCKILFMVKNESDRKTRGTKQYWEDKTIVKGRVMKILVKNAK
jgi:predicted SprT family Zn-dependent metalloprotease